MNEPAYTVTLPQLAVQAMTRDAPAGTAWISRLNFPAQVEQETITRE